MLRGVPPAAGPTGTVDRARTTPELHGAVRSGTAGCGLNRDHWPCTGRGSYASERELIRRLNGKPRPELDIDLYHGHPSPETRIWDRRSGQVVDGSGPMQDLSLGA